jgi:hypothetical protein
MTKKGECTMTQGEKAIWAAVYARGYAELKNPPHCAFIGERRDEWEAGTIASAIEDAGYAVLYLREAKERIGDGYSGLVKEFYDEMTGNDPDDNDM